jgi:hypothetical protein
MRQSCRPQQERGDVIAEADRRWIVRVAATRMPRFAVM